MNIHAFNCVLLLSFISWSSEAISAFIFNPKTVNACATVNCGQGTCLDTDNSLFGFECNCNSGWKKFQTGSLTLPPCIIPNCTINAGCGSGSPSPPPTLPRPVFNSSDPCSYTWCGDGNCNTNGTSYKCDCNSDSDHLLETTTLPCFKQCSLGADCHDLGLGAPSSPNSTPSPPNGSSSSHGLREVKKASPIKDAWTFLILGALFLPLL